VIDGKAWTPWFRGDRWGQKGGNLWAGVLPYSYVQLWFPTAQRAKMRLKAMLGSKFLNLVGINLAINATRDLDDVTVNVL
jgi:hypothetical protein